MSMKKRIYLLFLVVSLITLFQFNIVFANQFLLEIDSKETVYYNHVKHTEIVGHTIMNDENREQVIHYLGVNPQLYDDINIVVGDNFSNYGWGMTNLAGQIDNVHNRYDNFSVIGAVNADFYNMSIGYPVEIHVRNFEVIHQGVGGDGVVIGFKDNGEVIFGTPCFEGYELLSYDEIGALKKRIDIAGINRLPIADEVTVFFEDYIEPINGDFNKVILDTIEYKADGYGRYFGKGTLNSTVTEDVTISGHKTVVVGNGFNNDNLITDEGYTVIQNHMGCDFEGIRFAIGAGTRLVHEGVPITEEAYIRHPRTAIGVKEDGTVFFVTVDGRQYDDHRYGVTLYELAGLMEYFGAYEAYNLDGGGSTTMMFINDEGGYDYMNSPSDGQPRSISNSIMIVAGVHKPIPEPALFPDTRVLLDIPQNIFVDRDGTLRFDSVEESVAYMISIDGNEFELNDNQLELDLTPGTHEIKIKSLGDRLNFKTSEYSQTILFEVYAEDIESFYEFIKGFTKQKTFVKTYIIE